MKLVYSDKKTGKTAQLEVPKGSESMLIGKMMGEIVEGSIVGLDGFKLQITGLSDSAGARQGLEIEGHEEGKASSEHRTWGKASKEGIQDKEKREGKSDKCRHIAGKHRDNGIRNKASRRDL